MGTITIPAGKIVTAQMKAERALAAMLDAFEAAIQNHIDETARKLGYRDGFALTGYVASTVPEWAAEAVAFVAWRDAVWVYVHAELGKVTAGQREQPEPEEFIGELPAMEWPDLT